MDFEVLAGRLRIRHLQCLAAIAEEAHLGRAAEKLHVSQPAVSKTLAELEGLLGFRLFQRGRMGAALTREGQAFLPHAVTVLDAITAATRAAVRERAAPVEVVNVGTLPSAAPALLPDALEKFRASHPASRVVVVTDRNTPLTDMLRAGRLDFAIARMSDPERMAGLAFELLCMEPLLLVVRRGHPLLDAAPPLVGDVLEFPVLVWPKATTPRVNTDNFLEAHRLRLPANSVETMSLSLARLVTQRSDAVWFVPAGAVRDELAGGRLAALNIATDGTGEPIGITRRSDVRPSPAAHELMAAVREAAISSRREAAAR